MNSKSKIQEEARFQILRHLHENPRLSQRELCQRVGVSLGAVNYCLKALIDCGLVNSGQLVWSESKLGHAYFLTPAGMAEKARLSRRFLRQKIEQYETLGIEIEKLLSEIDSKSTDCRLRVQESKKKC